MWLETSKDRQWSWKTHWKRGCKCSEKQRWKMEGTAKSVERAGAPKIYPHVIGTRVGSHMTYLAWGPMGGRAGALHLDLLNGVKSLGSAVTPFHHISSPMGSRNVSDVEPLCRTHTHCVYVCMCVCVCVCHKLVLHTTCNLLSYCITSMIYHWVCWSPSNIPQWMVLFKMSY